MKLFHAVGRVEYGNPFRERSKARTLWLGLNRAFPSAIACMVMPNHIHLIAEGEPGAVPRVLGATLGALGRRGRLGPARFQPIPAPQVIPDLKHLARQIRYVHLNPCRAGLCKDPLTWEWSTHRDWIGATFNSWPDRLKWGGLLGWPQDEIARRIHRYVSGDPTVRVEGTALFDPRTHDVPLSWAARAVALAGRELWAFEDFSLPARRLLGAYGALRSGLSVRRLARRLYVASSTIHDWVQNGITAERLRAIDLIVGDERMLQPFSGQDVRIGACSEPNPADSGQPVRKDIRERRLT
ncbi:MAG TPA: hypothetical protein VL588_01875 [Bdellovibrionota bacterium]|jgi:hypothetical protein|nr:hypothetical protein [Bdellovibrionota bacterium]